MFPAKSARGRIAAARLGAGFLALAAVLPPLAAHAHDQMVGSIGIAHPWSRATPPGATTGAGYVTLSNEGTSDDRLVSASSPVAGETQIHEMKVENGVMQMKPVAGGIALPAGQDVALAPGGYHIMLMQLKRPLKPGDKVPVTLTFEKAGTAELTLDVGKIGAAAPGEAANDDSGMADHDMGAMGGHAGHDMGAMGK